MRETHCDAPSKGQTRPNTPSLLTLNGVLGFPVDANVAGKYASLDCAVIYLPSVGIFVLQLSVMLAIMNISGINGTNRPLSFSMNSNSVIYLCGAQENTSWETVKTKISASTVILSPPLILRHNRASAAWCFIPARSTTSN